MRMRMYGTAQLQHSWSWMGCVYSSTANSRWCSSGRGGVGWSGVGWLGVGACGCIIWFKVLTALGYFADICNFPYGETPHTSTPQHHHQLFLFGRASIRFRRNANRGWLDGVGRVRGARGLAGARRWVEMGREWSRVLLRYC